MRKKLFAVIMSVMMMVTFMPAMAFADPEYTSDYYVGKVEFSSDYSSATGEVRAASDNTKLDTVQGAKYNWNDKESQFISGREDDLNGSTMVGFRFNTGKYGNNHIPANKKEYDDLFVPAYYYDLTNAKLVIKNEVSGIYEAIEKIDTVQYGHLVDMLGNKSAWTFDDEVSTDTTQAKWCLQFGKVLGLVNVDNLYVQFNDNDGNKAYQPLKTILEAGAELTVYPLEGYEDFADGKYTLKYDFDCSNDIRTVIYHMYSYVSHQVWAAKNGSQEQTVELKTNTAPKLEDMKFNSGKKVNVSVWELLNLKYTGEDQKLTLATKGYVAQYYYKAEGETTRAWHDEAPVMVNADTYKVQVRFSPEGKTDWTSAQQLTLTINPQPACFKFKHSSYMIRGTKIDAKSKLTLKMDGEVVLADADKTVFSTIVDKYVTFTQENEDQFDSFEVIAKIDFAGLRTDKDAAIVQFVKNYNITNLNTLDEETADVVVSTNGNIVDNVTAVNQTKTFHIKKAAKLKKNKTFVLKGDKVEYGTKTYIKKSGNGKIKVASNGKVTVKKGLKKGTYTVKIKVKAAGDSETKTLKVRIVK